MSVLAMNFSTLWICQKRNPPYVDLHILCTLAISFFIYFSDIKKRCRKLCVCAELSESEASYSGVVSLATVEDREEKKVEMQAERWRGA
jgi:hypothetical protein